MELQNAKQILDDAVHEYVKIIIKYAYDMATYNETNVYIEQMEAAKKEYYDMKKHTVVCVSVNKNYLN